MVFKTKKPVMLYYSDAPVQPSKIDKTQFDKLEEFKKSIRNQGIQENYSSVEELKAKLLRHITIMTRGISVGTVVTASAIKEAKESTKLADAEPVAVTSTSNNNAAIFLEDYSEKPFVVCGDTLSKKEGLKALGGTWIKTRKGTFAWNFSKKKLKQVADFLNIAPVLSS